ncbi:MAG: hypothetical protein ACR2J8_01880, partial [Thermomicrobiales bacterium]
VMIQCRGLVGTFSTHGTARDRDAGLGAEGKALATAGQNLTARALTRFGQRTRQNGRFNGLAIVLWSFVGDVRFGCSPELFNGQAGAHECRERRPGARPLAVRWA